MVKIGNLTVNPYDVEDFIIYNKGNTCEAILRFRSGGEEVVLEGTREQCESLFSSNLCKRISDLSIERKTRKIRVFRG